MSGVLRLRACAVRMADGVAVRDGTEVPLTTKERELLGYLAAHPSQVVGRETLLADVWDYAPTAATRAVDMVVARLRRKIELNPSRPDHILTETGAGYRFEPAHEPPPEAAPSRGNLAPGLSSFVGRATDLAALDSLVRAHRLVTVMGPPGVGKTRLVREYGRTCVDRYEGGVWFCGLAEARDADDVRAAVAGVLGVESGEVGRALAHMGPTLLILDNFEQLVHSAPEVLAAWRGLAPGTTFVVTSRRRLGVEGEHTSRLEPLQREAAARLLHDRAHAPVEGGDDVIAALVDRLDRLPLAVELAAARLDVLAPSELLERLSAPLALLRSTRRDRAVRHDTLERAIAWSWDLLAPTEQALLADCTVFRGGFDLDAAEPVLATDGGAPVLDGIHSLWDKSLLDVRTVGDGRRFGLLPSIAAFASARHEPDAARAVRERHATYYLGHAEALATRSGDGTEDVVLAMEHERDNYLAACRALATDPVRLVRAVECLTPLLQQRGPHARWLALCDEAVHLARGGGASPILAAALNRRAHARAAGADPDGAERDCREAGALAGATPQVRAEALELLARLQGVRGDLDGALASALEGASVADDPTRRAWCHTRVGTVLIDLGRFDEANVHLARAAALHEEAGRPDQVLKVRLMEACGLVLLGELTRAREIFTECAAGWEQAGQGSYALIAHGELASLALELGEIDEGRAHLDAVERWIEQLGERHQLIELCMYRGLADHLDGDLAGARAAYAEGIRHNADERDQEYDLEVAALLAIAEAADGDLGAATSTLERARAAGEALATPIATQIARAAEACVSLASDSLSADAATQCIADARAVAPGQGSRTLRLVLQFLEAAVPQAG